MRPNTGATRCVSGWAIAAMVGVTACSPAQQELEPETARAGAGGLGGVAPSSGVGGGTEARATGGTPAKATGGTEALSTGGRAVVGAGGSPVLASGGVTPLTTGGATTISTGGVAHSTTGGEVTTGGAITSGSGGTHSMGGVSAAGSAGAIATGGMSAAGNGGAAGKTHSGTGGTSTSTPPARDYKCVQDSDCCVVLESCMATMWLVEKARKGAMESYVASLDRTRCVGCIPPAIQVNCDAGLCKGVYIASSGSLPAALMSSHCGPVTIPAVNQSATASAATPTIASATLPPSGTAGTAGSAGSGGGSNQAGAASSRTEFSCSSH